MTTSVTAICNMALSHLGVSSPIADVDTEQSKEAAACREFYEQTRDEVLRAFPWPFAQRRVTLAVVAEDPTDEWAYSYRYPTDALRITAIDEGFTRTPTLATRTPHVIRGDDSGSLLYMDTESAVVQYTARVTNVGLYPPDFTQTLACLLAAYIAPRVAGADQVKLRREALQLYQFMLDKATANAANEYGPDVPPESEFITVRG